MKGKNTGDNPDNKHCLLCRRDLNSSSLFVRGPMGSICSDCIVRSYSLLLSEGLINPEDEKPIERPALKDLNDALYNKTISKSIKNLVVPKPKEIDDFLNQYVVGQDGAKKYLCVAVYNHYKRLKHNFEITEDNNEVEIEKSNILMVGPTGTGKTLLARSIAKLLDVPFTIVDATVFTQAGYVGEDIESILTRLLQEADYDVKRAETGIVFIDEIDKLTRKNDNPSITRDVGGEGVQQGMLKLLEGSIVNVPPKGGRKHPDQEYIKINTQNILFICGGAFDGIERIIANRMNTKVIGYGNKLAGKRLDDKDLLQYVDARDLKHYGMIPELLGRLPVVTYLLPLDRDALLRIMTEPKNAIIKQYTKLFEIDGIEVDFTKEALEIIVDSAIEQKLGARGLRSITEKIMTDLMYNLPSSEVSKFSIDKDCVQKYLQKRL